MAFIVFIYVVGLNVAEYYFMLSIVAVAPQRCALSAFFLLTFAQITFLRLIKKCLIRAVSFIFELNFVFRLFY